MGLTFQLTNFLKKIWENLLVQSQIYSLSYKQASDPFYLHPDISKAVQQTCSSFHLVKAYHGLYTDPVPTKINHIPTNITWRKSQKEGSKLCVPTKNLSFFPSQLGFSLDSQI